MSFSFKPKASDFQSDFETLPEDNYNVLISNIDDKDGIIHLTLSIVEHEKFTNRKLFDKIVYIGEDDKVTKGRRKFAAIGKSIFGDDREFNLDDIYQKFLKVKTKNSNFNDKVYTNILFYSKSDIENAVAPF